MCTAYWKTPQVVNTLKVSSWTTDGKFISQNGLKDVRRPFGKSGTR